jgi:tetratricopeptide (TPR) repeat protein
LLSVLAVSGALGSMPVHAHGELDRAILAVSQDIAADPTVDRLLMRARLHLAHDDIAEALADCARAHVLEPGSAPVAFCRGRVLFVDGQPEPALAALDHCLALCPDDGDALELRATVLRELDRPAEALRDLDRREVALPPPQPQFYLDRLALQVVTAHPVIERLAGLEQGMRRLGALVVLEQAALRCEREAGLVDAAIARLERLISTAARPEAWLLERGDLLHSLGRHAEAEAAYREALTAIARLPAARRLTMTTRELSQRVESHLATLTQEPHP